MDSGTGGHYYEFYSEQELLDQLAQAGFSDFKVPCGAGLADVVEPQTTILAAVATSSTTK